MQVLYTTPSMFYGYLWYVCVCFSSEVNGVQKFIYISVVYACIFLGRKRYITISAEVIVYACGYLYVYFFCGEICTLPRHPLQACCTWRATPHLSLHEVLKAQAVQEIPGLRLRLLFFLLLFYLRWLTRSLLCFLKLVR